MRSHPSLDRQTFEAFLANAYAVQKSGLDAQSLAAIAEVQRFIASTEFDRELVLPLVAERALQVSHASGIAIALLESNDLVYRAGSGSASTEIGRRVPAVLTACTSEEGRPEILRVENAETDWRIQADICRQFGAASLLILPIYDRGAIYGVLQVHFNQAHSFSDREVRAYRLMAGLVEDAVRQSYQHEDAAAEITSKEACAIGDDVLFKPVFPEADRTFAQAAANFGKRVSTGAQLLASFATSGLLRESLRTSLESVRQIGRRTYALIVSNPWPVPAAISVAIVLVVGIRISHVQHPSQAIVNSTSSLPASETRQSVLPNPVTGNVSRSGIGHEGRDELRPSAAFRRIQIGPNEVDYIAEDVTIRHFTTRSPRIQPGSGGLRVDFGKDVTVRYFPNTSRIVSQTTPVSATTQAVKPSLPSEQ